MSSDQAETDNRVSLVFVEMRGMEFITGCRNKGAWALDTQKQSCLDDGAGNQKPKPWRHGKV